jgi:hypothetical protein
MKPSLAHRSVRLEFNSHSLVHSNLSGAAFSGDWLWVAGDEACGLDRLQALPTEGGDSLRFGEALNFPLADLLDLPGEADEEADIEGLHFADGYLWLVGSHGYKRKNAKDGRDNADNAKRLGKLALDGNRRLLARIPLEHDSDGRPVLVRKSRDGRTAACLRGDNQHNELTRLLSDDPHLADFLKIPGKDNGFDIEGLAGHGEHLLLGLRGPVLRGWTVILELAVHERHHELRLARLGSSGPFYRKHFLALDGLGIRDLYFAGDDLLILAGPTMVLNGDIEVFRWANALQALSGNQDINAFWKGIERVASLPHGYNTDRAEAITPLPVSLTGGADNRWLTLYDAPDASRQDGELTVYGDILELPRQN